MRANQPLNGLWCTPGGLDPSAGPTIAVYLNTNLNVNFSLVSNISTGFFVWASGVPAEAVLEDTVSVVITATVGGVSTKYLVFEGRVDDETLQKTITTVISPTSFRVDGTGLGYSSFVGGIVKHMISKQRRVITALLAVEDSQDIQVEYDLAFDGGYPEEFDQVQLTPGRTAALDEDLAPGGGGSSPSPTPTKEQFDVREESTEISES